jgi:hypothetical protein
MVFWEQLLDGRVMVRKFAAIEREKGRFMS